MKKNFIINLIYELFVVLTPLILTPYLSRVLTSSGIGIKSYTFSITYYFALAGSLGVATYGQRIISIAKNNYERSKSFYEISILKFISMGFSIIIFCLLFFVIKIEKNYTIYYISWVLYLLEMLFNVSWFYYGIEKFSTNAIVNIFYKFLSIICIFIFVKKPDDLVLYLIIFNLFPLLGTATLNLFLFRKLEKVPFKDIKIFHHLKETIVYFLPTIATTLYSTLDKTMIGKITHSEEQNGFYEQAEKIVKFALGILTSSYAIVRSRFTILVKENNVSEIKKTEETIMDLANLIIWPLFIGLFICSEDFVPIFFGDGYNGVINIMQIMSFLTIVLSLSGLINSIYIYPYNKQKYANKFYFLIVIVNFILNFFLIKRYMAEGAAVASVISETLLFIIFLIYCKKVINFKYFLKSSVKPIFASFIMAVFLIISHVYLDNSLLILIFRVVFAILIYFCILVLVQSKIILKGLGILFTKFKSMVLNRNKVNIDNSHIIIEKRNYSFDFLKLIMAFLVVYIFIVCY